MSNKLTRLLFLCSQVVISLVILIVFIVALNGGESMGPMIKLCVPCVIQTLSNLVFSVILFFGLKRTTSLDMQIAPILLLSTSMENIRIFSYYSEYSFREPISQTLIAQVFFFSLIISAVMFCGLSIAPFFKSYVSLNSYLLAGTLGSVLVMVLGPRIVNLEHLNSINIYMILVYILYTLALVSFLIELLSNLHTFNVLRQLAQMSIVAGDFLLTIYNKATVNYLGLTLFLLGEVILSGMIFASSRGIVSDQSETEVGAL